MARKKIVESPVSPPCPEQVRQAADLMNEGTDAPKQAHGFAIHLARDAAAHAFLCGKTYDRQRTVQTVVSRDHPALCPQCALAARAVPYVPQPMLERSA
jgi:hypothetical protein